MGITAGGVLSFGGFTRESNSCLKGAGDEYSHGPMRPTVWNHQLGKITSWGTMDIWVSAEQIWENLEKSSVLILSKGNNDKICPVLVWSMSDLRG